MIHEDLSWPELALEDPRVIVALATWGAPYDFAEGDPSTADEVGSVRDGADCSGHAQEVLVRAGELRPDAIDRNAWSLAMACDLVDEDAARPFDLYFYGRRDSSGKVVSITHVGVCVGRHACLTASGGGRTTHGDDARAFVHLERHRYRSDFLFAGRIKPEHRATPRSP